MSLPVLARLPVCVGLGIAAASGLAPLHLWPASLIALALLFGIALKAPNAALSALYLWAFGLGWFGFGLRWLIEPFQIEAELFGWMAPIALLLMAGGLALFWAVAGWVGHRLGGPLTLVLALSIAEYARAYLLTGFPWAGFAQIWIETSFAQALAQIGPQGLGFLTLALAAGLAVKGWVRRLGWTAAVFTVLILVSLRPALKIDEADQPIIRLVQPNAPQREKWDPATAGTFFWRQVDFTGAPATGGDRPDLIVWPETAIPQLLDNARVVLDHVAEAAAGTPVVIGIQRRDQEDYFNTAFVLDGDGQVQDIYDKHHLVPFGEYLPFPALFRATGIAALSIRADGGYKPGPGPRLIDLPAIGQALPLICYEAIFPQYARSPEDVRPRFLMQLTNDAWFGERAGPQQHLAQARMRAIEQGLPLIRAANTGISAAIGPKGQILAALPLGEDGFIDTRLPPAYLATLYAQLGDRYWFAVFMILLLGRAVSHFRNSD